MIRRFAIGLLCLSPILFGGCSTTKLPPPVAYKAPPADVPDAALVADCDTSDNSVATNGELADELPRVRGQRNDCATRMKGVQQWRFDAIKRASDPKKH